MSDEGIDRVTAAPAPIAATDGGPNLLLCDDDAPLRKSLQRAMERRGFRVFASESLKEGVSLAHLIEPDLNGRRVGLQFQLPGSEEVIYAEGEVVREWASLSQKREGSGVKFTLLTERHRRLIEQYVSRHTSE